MMRRGEEREVVPDWKHGRCDTFAVDSSGVTYI